jgi:hypothetical protein
MCIYSWSVDSSQLYFGYSWSSDGGDPPIQVPCSNLQQVDIKTGKVRSVEMSPDDDDQIVYISCQTESCIVHAQNISTGVDKTITIDSKSGDNLVQTGYIDWHFNKAGFVDGNSFIFHLQSRTHIIQTIYFNVLTMKYKVVKIYPAPGTPGWAEFVGWVDENTLEFLESGIDGIQVIHVDIRNDSTIVIGTPTPTPGN